MTSLERQRLFGLDFVTGTTVAELADALLREASSATTQWRCVVTPNVDHLVRYRSRVDEHTVAEHAFMVLPDGMPIVWASRLLRASLSGRLPGSDLFARLWPQIAEHSTPTVILASSERVASLLRAEHPNVEMIVAPMFDLDDHETIETLVTQMVDASRRIDARFLFITVSMPKHHLLALRLEQRWRDDSADAPSDKPTVMLVGASPEFYLGLTKRAPRWMQRSGFEWLHRLVLEPRRMGRRYLVDDPKFMLIVWDEWKRRRRGDR